MPTLIPKRARINDVLSLRQLIEAARDELLTATRELDELERSLRRTRLRVGTASAGFDSIVAIYNRLVVEYEPEPRRRTP